MSEEKQNTDFPGGNDLDDEDFEIEILDPGDPTGYYSSASNEPEISKPAEQPIAESPELSSLEKRFEEIQKEKEEIQDRLLRKLADFENLRKRTEKEKREYRVFALSDFMLDLLQILDNFERALLHPEEQTGADYRKGVELIYRQLKDLAEKRGLRPIHTEGQAFDPKFHEAIAREERNDLPDNTILEELQKGYLFVDKLLRPSMVKVSFRPDDPHEETELPEGPEKAQNDGE